MSDENISAFDQHAKEYDEWFDRHQPIFQSELLALKKGSSDFSMGTLQACHNKTILMCGNS